MAEQARKDRGQSCHKQNTYQNLARSYASGYDPKLSQEDPKRRQTRNADDSQGEQSGRNRHRLEQASERRQFQGMMFLMNVA